MKFQFAKTLKSLYLEASSEREVRQYLKDRNYNIEYIQLLEGNYLEYEQNSPNFRLGECLIDYEIRKK